MQMFLQRPSAMFFLYSSSQFKRIRLTLSSLSSFSFSSSFFVVFVFFIYRANRGVVYMRVIGKFSEFGGFVATVLGRSEHVRRWWFDGCEGRTQPFLDDSLECVSESVMLQKTRLARAGGELNKGNFLRCTHTH